MPDWIWLPVMVVAALAAVAVIHMLADWFDEWDRRRLADRRFAETMRKRYGDG